MLLLLAKRWDSNDVRDSRLYCKGYSHGTKNSAAGEFWLLESSNIVLFKTG